MLCRRSLPCADSLLLLCSRVCSPNGAAGRKLITSLPLLAKEASAVLEREHGLGVDGDDEYFYNLTLYNIAPVVEDVKMWGESKDKKESTDEEENKEGDAAGESKDNGKKGDRRSYGVDAVRVVQSFVESGLPLCKMGSVITTFFPHGNKVELDTEHSKIKSYGKMVKLVALGVGPRLVGANENHRQSPLVADRRWQIAGEGRQEIPVLRSVLGHRIWHAVVGASSMTNVRAERRSTSSSTIFRKRLRMFTLASKSCVYSSTTMCF